jgi:hypothetical protein
MEAWGFVMTAVDAARAAVLATGLLSEVLWLGEPESEDPTLF